MQKPLIRNTPARKVVCDIYVRKIFQTYFRDSKNGLPRHLVETAARDMMGARLEGLDFVQESMLVKKCSDRIEAAVLETKMKGTFEEAEDARDLAIGARVLKWTMIAVGVGFAIFGSIEGAIVSGGFALAEYVTEKFKLKKLERVIVSAVEDIFCKLCEK